MKKNFMLAAFLSLFVALSASAQDKAANFSGTWTLDVSKSKMSDRMPIESQTLTVTQTDKDIKIETATKRPPPPTDAPQGGQMGGRKPGSAMGDGTKTYSLDGKEAKTDVEGPMGSMPEITKAKIESGKLKLSNSRSFSGPMGEVTMTSKETWELSSDGNTLTVNSERSTPRGSESSTKVFTKKS
ncbi:MAG: hypothetical protein IPL32_06745 [Chloracidobacterium sp.]|nr:hypothetical protein [Chloracidobacterium sp.]